MIQLPENWQETVRVYPPTKALFLHFKNDANQYFTYYYTLDPAFTIEETLDKIEHNDWTNEQPYVLAKDLITIRQEALDQNWVAAPLPDLTMCSLAQYRAQLSMQVREDEQAKRQGSNATT
jgi:hypothetical protein